MNKAKKRFVLYAVVSIFVLLSVILGIINCLNFTMAAQDADIITENIASHNGEFGKQNESFDLFAPGQENGQLQNSEDFARMGPMGPDSPETNKSVRFFTVSFDDSSKGKIVAFKISAIDEEEAISWAQSLVNESTGWTHGTYRYRVYEQGNKTYVTVIDQGREMLSAYRILIFSVFGTIAGALLSFFILKTAAKKLFSPIEEADRKQKQFILNAEKEFKLPLTVISANAEIIERESGPTDQTRSIHRQVRRMDTLVRNVMYLTMYENENLEKTSFNLSELLNQTIDRNKERFSKRDLDLRTDIQPDILFSGEIESVKQMLNELVENAMKYAQSYVLFTLKKENSRIKLVSQNATELPSGSADEAFDRFTVLDNAQPGSVGLGLSYVKDTVKKHNGRVTAKVADSAFTIQIDL
ncbi:MAG: HAMP domain-containing histidine kinase [Clostridia bacterium]|nr:HAMP domain-containing histidine kinase [Clostridia bacterium]